MYELVPLKLSIHDLFLHILSSNNFNGTNKYIGTINNLNNILQYKYRYLQNNLLNEIASNPINAGSFESFYILKLVVHQCFATPHQISMVSRIYSFTRNDLLMRYLSLLTITWTKSNLKLTHLLSFDYENMYTSTARCIYVQVIPPRKNARNFR